MGEEKIVRELASLVGEKYVSGNMFERMAYGQDAA
jgi:hypothetical protein